MINPIQMIPGSVLVIISGALLNEFERNFKDIHQVRLTQGARYEKNILSSPERSATAIKKIMKALNVGDKHGRQWRSG